MGEDVCEQVAWASIPKSIPLELLSVASLRPAPTGHSGWQEMHVKVTPLGRQNSSKIETPLSQSKGSVEAAGRTVSYFSSRFSFLSHELMSARPSQDRLHSLGSRPEVRPLIYSANAY